MKDVFGLSVARYWSGQKDSQIHVRRDDGFIDQHSPGIWFSERQWDSELPFVRFAHGRMLDVGCGVGRHLLHFQQLGFEIEGLDVSELALDVCRQRGGQNLRLANICADPLPESSFDTILLFGNNIGIGGTPDGIMRLLTKLAQALRPGGHILVAALNVSRTENPQHQAYHDFRRRRAENIGRITIRLEYEDMVGDWFEWMHPLPAELDQLSKSAGLRVDDLIETTSGSYGALLSHSSK